jgi:predicted glycoside hydrolase/deacetylase ChbG (UPF0249 family)
MMFMEYSERAAALARSHGLPAGLHLNLTMTSMHPAALHLVRDCVEDQLQEFHRIYGGPPTHIDGTTMRTSARTSCSRAPFPAASGCGAPRTGRGRGRS